LIIQNDEGDWVAKCELCQWSTIQTKRKNAENNLRNHINMVHKEGIKGIKQQNRPTSRSNLPPNLPDKIKEI
jgi:hypothetical protein